MGVQFKATGLILFSQSDSIALDPNCCCGAGDCLCFIEADNAAECCDCIEAEFGEPSTKPALGVYVEGDTTFRGVAVFTCPQDIDELFMVECGTTELWYYHQNLGTSTISGVTYRAYMTLKLTLSYCSTPTYSSGQLNVEMRSIQFRDTELSLPLDQWTQDGPSAGAIPAVGQSQIEANAVDSWKRRSWDVGFDTFLNYDWRYVLGGTCTESCNEYTQWPYCQSTITFTSRTTVGLPANYYDNTGPATSNRCNVVNLTFTPYSANNP